MRQSTLTHLERADVPALLQPRPPAWVTDAIPIAHACEPTHEVRVSERGPLALITCGVPAAGHLDADALRTAVACAYAELGRALKSVGREAIRLWNYLPNPNQMMAPGLDRYMVFNAGRHEGYLRWFDDPGQFGTSLATATAVGIHGDALVVHCLGSDAHGQPVENPRQKPAWRYSARYGPMPPSFSRATVATVDGRRRLLIGGTASIVGEDSQHVGDVAAQLSETLCNLATLVASASGKAGTPDESLARITDVRVYITRDTDAPLVLGTLRDRCPNAERIEAAVARLCRPELLVEIEGVADIE